eukprot:92208-Hanusia_phi.AAC.1
MSVPGEGLRTSMENEFSEARASKRFSLQSSSSASCARPPLPGLLSSSPSEHESLTSPREGARG